MSEHPATRCALVGSVAQAGHFAGVPEALASLGADSILECSQRHAPVRLPAWLLDTTHAVLHAETSPSRAASIVLSARRAGRPCALLMDGVCDFANTFQNPDEPSLLRPPPGDVVFAAGRHDRDVLRALGARAIATGLPRLDAVHPTPPASRGESVLIATATRPCMTSTARPRLIAALEETRDTCNASGVRAVWRIPSDLANELGVTVDTAPLTATLGSVRAVISTASTLVIEAMLAGLPVGVLHPHPWPLWLPAVWRWHCDGGVGAETDATRARRAGPAAEAATNAARASARTVFSCAAPPAHTSIAGMLASLMQPKEELVRAQLLARRRLASPRAARRVARALVSLPSVQTQPHPAPLRLQSSSERVNVVSVIGSHDSSVGGVSVWSERLERWFDEHPCSGISWRTLFVGPSAPPPIERVDTRPNADALLLDPTAPDAERVRDLALRLRGADIVVPNYGWLPHAAAAVAQAGGARVLTIAHTDDEYTRNVIRRFPPAGAVVSVNRGAVRWLAEHDAPIETILYGVPEHAPRAPRARDQPLRIVSIGRVVEQQKRISDLIPVLALLQRDNVEFRFHLIGDGAGLSGWLHTAEESGIAYANLTIHGALPPASVQGMLGSFDVFVLASEAEGTSIAALEAMAAGVVPVVTDTPGMADLITNGVDGELCPVADAVAMAEALKRYAVDPDRLTFAAAAAQATITRRGLTETHCASRYAEIIHRLTNTPAPSVSETATSALQPESLWRARGASEADSIMSLTAMLGTDEASAPTTAGCTRSAAHTDPGLDNDPRAHLTRAFELARGAGPVAVAATGTRSLPALEWLARHRRNQLSAFLVPGVTHRATFFGVPALPFDRCPPEARLVLVPHPEIDRTGILAAVAHVLDRTAELSFPEFHSREIELARSFLASRAHTLTTFPPGVVPDAISLPPENIAQRVLHHHAGENITVLLRGDDSDFSVAAALARWISDGGDLRSPSWSLAELTSPARCAALTHGRSYAFYGSGAHTRRLLRHMPPTTPRPSVVYDDNPNATGGMLDGAPVLHPDCAPPAPGDLVVLSSITYEEALWDRTAPWRDAGVHVLRLYKPTTSARAHTYPA